MSRGKTLWKARRVVADMVEGSIRAGDEWTWKRADGKEDRALTEALRVVAAELRSGKP